MTVLATECKEIQWNQRDNESAQGNGSIAYAPAKSPIKFIGFATDLRCCRWCRMCCENESIRIKLYALIWSTRLLRYETVSLFDLPTDSCHLILLVINLEVRHSHWSDRNIKKKFIRKSWNVFYIISDAKFFRSENLPLAATSSLIPTANIQVQWTYKNKTPSSSANHLYNYGAQFYLPTCHLSTLIRICGVYFR